MPDRFVSEVEKFSFRVVDFNDNPVIGLTLSDFSISVKKKASGDSDFSAAAETTSFAEEGSGVYSVAWTFEDGSEGRVYWIQVIEQSSIPLSKEATHETFVTVGLHSQTFTEDDAFCSVEDVQARVGRGTYSATTVPTLAQLLDVMAWRASNIESVLHTFNVLSTVASGSSPINVSTDDGRVLANLCRQANVLAAAGDAIFLAETRDVGGAIPEKSVAFFDQFDDEIAKIKDFCRRRLIAPTVHTATGTGGVEKKDFAPSDTAEQSKSALWNLNTKW